MRREYTVGMNTNRKYPCCLVGQDARDISQVGMLRDCLAVVDGGDIYPARLGG